ncbi:MAG TPA: hypothetical protein PKL31_11780 [Fulvivirga sp.]|nr:hypothetical protein [Fulvivirga sp.]
MNNSKLNFKSEKLFPWQFQFVGILSMLAGVVISLTNLLLAPILILIGILILTAYRGILFNASKRVYKDYNSFLGIQIGTESSYESVEKIYINASNMSQTIYSRANNKAIAQYEEYNAYLKFGDGTKLFICSSKNKSKLIEKLGVLKEFFQLEVMDNTI